MVSHLAESDIATLEARFGRIAFPDALRLNGLGLLVERAADTADVVEAPRVAWAGSAAFREPTVQASLWFDECACRWWSGKGLFCARAWSCAHAYIPEFFLPYQDEKAARRAISSWRVTIPCTDAQIAAALRYAVFGEADPEAPDPAAEPVRGCPVTAMVNRAVAAGLGISYERLLAMPFRRIMDILIRWSRNMAAASGTLDPEAITARVHDSACANYFRALDEITNKYTEA